MNRKLLVGPLLIVIAGAAWAQPASQIRWINQPGEAIAIAKRTHKPLMILVAEGRGEDNDLRDAQQRALRMPSIVQYQQTHFVPLRLQRSSANANIFNELGIPMAFGFYLAFATPDGKLIPGGMVQGAASANPQLLLNTMNRLFQTYRRDFFDTKLRELLDNENAADNDLVQSLALINDMMIPEATDAVVRLLERRNLNKRVEKAVYETLSTLSTEKAVEALLKAAKTEKFAERALFSITPGGAAYLVPYLTSDDKDLARLAYMAGARVTKLDKPKSERFWENAEPADKTDEIERARKHITEVAERWNEQFAEWR